MDEELFDFIGSGEPEATPDGKKPRQAGRGMEPPPAPPSCAVFDCERPKQKGSNCCQWHRTFKDGILYRAEQKGGKSMKAEKLKQMQDPKVLTG